VKSSNHNTKSSMLFISLGNLKYFVYVLTIWIPSPHLAFGVAEAPFLTIITLETSCDIPKGMLNGTIRKIKRIPHQGKTWNLTSFSIIRRK